jgi:predicted ATP-grasp superfamily ATP-dependent carboligase
MPQPAAFVLTHRSVSDPGAYSASFQALHIARSLGRRGIPVVRVHPGRRELSLYSRYCTSVEQSPNVHESEKALLDFLLELAPKYPGPRVLLPASDETAHFIGRYRDELLAAYRVPAPGSVMETIIDKRRQYGAAQALGIPIPDTYFPADAAEAKALAGMLRGYPYIIKPNVAHHWRLASVKQHLKSAGAIKAVVVHDAAQLVAEYRRISAVDPAVMIQKVIGGGDERLYCFYGYFDEHSRMLGCCVRRKLRQLPLGFGYSTALESCENDTVVEQSVRLLQGLKYHGIVAIEWKHDPESGETRLIEINARATNAAALPTACGVDLPYLAFADALGQSVAPVKGWKCGVKWIWLAEDVWAAREMWRRGELKLVDWLRSLRGPKVFAIYAADDLKPFLVDLGVFLKTGLGRRLRRLRDHWSNRRSNFLRTT